MKRVKYFKYSSFGSVTLYLGDISSGITLGSVIQLVKSETTKILANIHLYGLPSQPFDLLPIVENPEEYFHSTIFIDNAEFLVGARMHMSKQNKLFTYLVVMSRKLDIKFILNSHQLEALDKRVRQNITDIVRCKFIPKQKLLLRHYKLAWKTVWILNKETGKMERASQAYYRPVSECLLKRVGKYYKYFDTLEITGIPGKLLEVGNSGK